MQREYEMTVITASGLGDGETQQLLDKYEKILTGDGGEILKRDPWGVKRLAYPIKKQFRGRYTLYDFVTDPKNVTEAERLMRIDENVLRYLAIKLGEDVDIEKRKAELAKEPEPAPSAPAPKGDAR